MSEEIAQLQEKLAAAEAEVKRLKEWRMGIATAILRGNVDAFSIPDAELDVRLELARVQAVNASLAASLRRLRAAAVAYRELLPDQGSLPSDARGKAAEMKFIRAVDDLLAPWITETLSHEYHTRARATGE
jgi:hypothetical protein